MTTTILFGLTFVLLVYKVYADEKKSQSYLEEIYRLHRINTELEGGNCPNYFLPDILVGESFRC